MGSESVLAVALALALVDDLERRGGKKERLFKKNLGDSMWDTWLLKLTCHMFIMVAGYPGYKR